MLSGSDAGYPLIARGARVKWDRELHARRAVVEEEGELSRMQVATNSREHDQPEVQYSVQVAALMKERDALLTRLERQVETLAEWKAELERLRRSAVLAHNVFVDLQGSKGYHLFRLMGRWRSIERGMRRAMH